MPWLFPILAYLVGSIPFGVLIARSRGVDIRQHGSGNVGATNIFRVIGRGFGIFCLLLDFLKGFLPVVLATNLLRVAGETPAVPLPFLWDFTGELPADRQLYVHSIQVITALAAIMDSSGFSSPFMCARYACASIISPEGEKAAIVVLVK